MHRGDEMPLIGPEAPMAEALLVMTQRKASAWSGWSTRRARWSGSSPTATCGGTWTGSWSGGSEEVMTRAAADDLDARRSPRRRSGVMNAQKITTLFATDPEAPERPAGILHVHDCLRAGVT